MIAGLITVTDALAVAVSPSTLVAVKVQEVVPASPLPAVADVVWLPVDLLPLPAIGPLQT